MEKLTLNDRKDHIYFNISINGEGLNKIAEFTENRVVPILENSNNYELTVERFNLPTKNIPIFIWRNNEWYISITYKTATFTREIPFIQNKSVSNKYFGDAIYQYQDYVDCINLCYKQLFQDFQADPIYLTIPVIDRPTQPPKMTYDAVNKRCSIYYPLEYDITKPDPIYVYYGALMFSVFPAFQNYGDETNQILSHYLIVKDNKNNVVNVNGTNYFKLTEEWKELFLWNDFQQINFETDKIPVTNEYIGATKNIFRKVLTDFEPLVSINDQSNIQFYPSGPLRFYSLFSDIELRDVDLKIFWQTKDGKVFPLTIKGDDKLTIKIYFKTKGGFIISDSFF